MGKTIADMFIARGRKAGRKEGREEARREVRREVLLNQLRERFGELLEATVAAIQASKNIQELDSWLRHVVKAKTLAEIGIG